MIRYVCISDLHAGAITSLLTDLSEDGATGRLGVTHGKTSPLTRAFAAAFESFMGAAPKIDPKPQLILLGDVLDLQFSDRAHATTGALGFLNALAATDALQDEVLATAGNHDHALWTDARLDLHATAFASAPDDPDYREATRAFPPSPTANSRLLTALLKEAGFGTCAVRYPNLGFRNDHRAVVLHHGHFVESEYRLMSNLRDALENRSPDGIDAATLAAENAGWIDFFWSTFGDAAGLGHDVELVYQNILTTTGFRRLSRGWADKAAHALSEALPMAGNLSMQDMLGIVTRVGFDVTLGRFRDTERFEVVEALSESGREGLQWYLQTPVRAQLEQELRPSPEAPPEIPDDITFIFGHTHKPFTERIVAGGYAAPIKVMNTGGWTLNGPRLDNAEGASMVLISEDLHVANLRLFVTPQNGEVPVAHVEMLSDGSKDAADFKAELDRRLKADPEVWTALAEAAKTAYDLRRDYLLQLTADRMDARTHLKAAE